MRVTHPIKLGTIKPQRGLIQLVRKGFPLDFTNGINLEKLPPALLDMAAQQGFVPADSMCLGLHGRGSVMPHTDDVYGTAAVVWLLADTATSPSALMVAKGGPKGVLEMEVGDVCIFPSLEYHAWVSRSAWAMVVIDVRAKRKAN